MSERKLLKSIIKCLNQNTINDSTIIDLKINNREYVLDSDGKIIGESCKNYSLVTEEIK